MIQRFEWKSENYHMVFTLEVDAEIYLSPDANEELCKFYRAAEVQTRKWKEFIEQKATMKLLKVMI